MIKFSKAIKYVNTKGKKASARTAKYWEANFQNRNEVFIPSKDWTYVCGLSYKNQDNVYVVFRNKSRL